MKHIQKLLFLTVLMGFVMTLQGQMYKPLKIEADEELEGYEVRKVYDQNIKTCWRMSNPTPVNFTFNGVVEVQNISFYLGDSLKPNLYTRPREVTVLFSRTDPETGEQILDNQHFRFNKPFGYHHFSLRTSFNAETVSVYFNNFFQGNNPEIELYEIIIMGDTDDDDD